MKFALINNNKILPSKGAIATCPNCGSIVIAKCGDIKIDHWAHKSLKKCDPWWENETEWHRQWKWHFDKEWQEYIFKDELTGEKHIADIRTDYEWIIEFQHSFIDATERLSREQFYKKMIWVVDGTRLKKDYQRFVNARESLRRTNQPYLYIVTYA